MVMTEKRIIEMMSKIENYIFGKLNHQEINNLWIEFLKEPEWLSILEIEACRRACLLKTMEVGTIPTPS